ncbi:MAG: hypothetical protein FWE89_00950, partial [Syntrophaceae bacterium]|nr:hypothetical protein [Syntrophaceae bacterium]
MNSDRKIIWQHVSPHYNRSVLQPLAVALVCAIFIGLFLTMGVVDLKRNESTLRGFTEDQGRRIAEVVERLTKENMEVLLPPNQKPGEANYSPAGKRAINDKIVDLAREIDLHWKREHLSASYIHRHAEEKKLWYLAVLNAWGQVIHQNRELEGNMPKEALKNRKPLTYSELIALLNKLRPQTQTPGYIAIRRIDDSGTIIIAPDRDSFQYWINQVAVEKAIEKLGEGESLGLVYLTVLDRDGMPLGAMGTSPEDWERENLPDEGGENPKPEVQSRTVVDHEGRRLLEAIVPFKMSGQPDGLIRLGLDRGNTDQIVNENRRNML